MARERQWAYFEFPFRDSGQSVVLTKIEKAHKRTTTQTQTQEIQWPFKGPLLPGAPCGVKIKLDSSYSQLKYSLQPINDKNSVENILPDLYKWARTRTQSRRLARRKDASWSLNWPSGANLLAHKPHMYFIVPL